MIPPALTPILLSALHEAGETAPITRIEPMKWGCVSKSHRIVTRRRSYLLKYHENPRPFLYSHEQHGLERLREAGARVPTVLAFADASEEAPGYCIQEWIEPKSKDAFARRLGARLGEQLARVHLAETGSQNYGTDYDSEAGPQAQAWVADWVVCYRDRLGHLVERGGQKGILSPERVRGLAKLLDRLDSLLGNVERRPSLLHGDLHGRNVLCDRAGESVLIDPVIYYGDREVEMAYTTLYNDFPPGFFHAYKITYPLDPGFSERRDLYIVYDLLNNMMGGRQEYGRRLDEIVTRYVGYAGLS